MKRHCKRRLCLEVFEQRNLLTQLVDLDGDNDLDIVWDDG